MDSTDRRRFLSTLSALPTAGLWVAAAARVHAQENAALAVTGSFIEKTVFSLDRLAQLPQKEIAESREIEREGVRRTRRIVYRGVLLRDLILATGFKDDQRIDYRRTLFIARASDGYIALFTWGELFNSEPGSNVLVIIEADGKPLPDSEGPLALRSLSDIRPGPRHVKWLREIEVVRIEK